MLAGLILAAALGVANPAVTQATISTTVCVPGWTATVRPPRAYTYKLKIKQMKALGLPGKSRRYEEDHFWPLGLGGHPTDPGNLRPQPWAGKRGAKAKDVEEKALIRAVCAGTVTLDEARQKITKDWGAP